MLNVYFAIQTHSCGKTVQTGFVALLPVGIFIKLEKSQVKMFVTVIVCLTAVAKTTAQSCTQEMNHFATFQCEHRARDHSIAT